MQVLHKIYKRIRVLKALWSARLDTNRRLQKNNIRHLLIICYGNIYRSPFIEKQLDSKLNNSFQIQSAGFYPKENRVSPENYITMAKEFSIDLSTHKSKTITKYLLDWSDIIVIMDRHNWYRLVDFGDETIEKVVWLGALLQGRSVEIIDPYGMTQDEVKKIIKQLYNAGDELANHIIKTSSTNY